ncbi:hypothetical protein NP493_3055g00004 [Ridgeia piscesae]|uniref:Uncharacterized protein n=1 Tax=Ridgeia piscesae TaxID=27915 RepID=A0AAD9JAG9_RIDPI|nr:hypothetical protein NP493_3055g00004 [Ridgeia piscesae]
MLGTLCHPVFVATSSQTSSDISARWSRSGDIQPCTPELLVGCPVSSSLSSDDADICFSDSNQYKGDCSVTCVRLILTYLTTPFHRPAVQLQRHPSVSSGICPTTWQAQGHCGEVSIHYHVYLADVHTSRQSPHVLSLPMVHTLNIWVQWPIQKYGLSTFDNITSG